MIAAVEKSSAYLSLNPEQRMKQLFDEFSERDILFTSSFGTRLRSYCICCTALLLSILFIFWIQRITFLKHISIKKT